MPLGTPEVYYDAFSPYQVVITTPSDQGTLVANLEVKYNADGFTSDTVMEKFQELLDYLNASPDFTVAVAQRVATGSQSITPSA